MKTLRAIFRIVKTLIAPLCLLASTPALAIFDGATPYVFRDTLYGDVADGPAYEFGNAVSVSGTRMAVGAQTTPCQDGPADCGSVFVYERVNDQWIQMAHLFPPEDTILFGASVAIDGDWLIVGAPQETRAGFAKTGNVYFYHFDGSAWTLSSTAAPAPTAGLLGSSVAISAAGIAVAGIPNYSDSGGGLSKNGAVVTFVLDHASNTWSAEALKLPPNEEGGASFGYSVSVYTYRLGGAVNGYALAVGEPNRTVSAKTQAGAGYVFTRGTSDTSWTYRASYSLNTTAHDFEYLGSSTSIYGGAIAFGVPGRIIAGGHNPGSVYTIHRNTTDWTDYTDYEIPSPDTTSGVQFGDSVAMYGNTMFVGAPQTALLVGNPPQSQSAAGVAYQFDYLPDLSGFYWGQTTNALIAPNHSENAQFGHSVAFGGSLPVIGAINGAGGPAMETGAVYTYISDAIFADGFETN